VIVLDTTVLVYAKGESHPLRDPCRELLSLIGEGWIEATTTAEVIQEFVHVRARRRGRTDAVSLGGDYAELLAPLVSIGDDVLRLGLRLFERVKQLHAFDAVLAAAATSAGASALVSADRAFARVPGIRHVAPDEQGIRTLFQTENPPPDPATGA
jgi:uncharacterized protein